MLTQMPRDPEKQREYNRRYYERNRHIYLAKNERKRQKMKEFLREIKAVPCGDCGNCFPSYVMDFDHREGKEYLVGRLVNHTSWKRLLTEMAKCDIVCANCHRIRTYGQPESTEGPVGPTQERLKLWDPEQ